jgi:hypothetical protein
MSTRRNRTTTAKHTMHETGTFTMTRPMKPANHFDHPLWPLSRDQALRQLDGYAQRHSRKLFRLTVLIIAVFALPSITVVWATSNGSWALFLAILFTICILLSYPFSRSDARKKETAFRALDWERGIGFVSPSHGIVYLGARTWAMGSKGLICHPGGVGSVWYDSESNSLNLTIWYSGNKYYREEIKLPSYAPAAEVENLVTVLTKAWGLEKNEQL